VASWQPWSPAEVQARLRAVTAPWYIAAGWALDLFRGGQTREHEDIEIGLPNAPEAFGEVRAALAWCEFEAVGGGQFWPVDSPAFTRTHQTWVSEAGPPGPDGRPERIYRLDVFREPHRDGCWVCRRDDTIVLPYDQVIRRDGTDIPYLAPHLALLFKAKAIQPKDQADFDGVLPLLAPGERSWLAAAVQGSYPGHPWLDRL
jgi:hypothetical protein